MSQRHHGFEQGSGAGGGFGVTDLRLDRTQRAPLTGPVGQLAKSQLETFKLGNVAGFGGRAVRVDQFHFFRAVTGVLIGAFDGQRLPLRHRRVHAFRSTVRRRAQAADDGINPVAIALGVGQPAQSHHAETFADDRAVGRV